MKIVVLNFKRSNQKSVIETLELNKYSKNEICEVVLDEFFDDKMYKILKEIDLSISSGGGGKIVAFNYPLITDVEKGFAQLFFKRALESSDNLYYYPKPNHYTEVDDFALFSLNKNITPENFKVESLYRNGYIQRDFRGKMHVLLRKDKNIDEKYINKKFFYESRKLFNISWDWREFVAPRENLEYDLLERVDLFYPYPKGINIATSNVCNLKCVMCPLFSEDLKDNQTTDFFKTKQYLDDNVVYSAIDYLAQAKSFDSTIGFTSHGEATLDLRLPKFIRYARDKGIPYVYIVTNGTLLESKGEELLEAGLNRMTISIDGATAETYRKVRGADLNKVENGVKKCIEYARKLNAIGGNIEFELNCVLTDIFVDSGEKELYLDKWKDYRDIIKKIFFTRMVVYDKNGMDINRVVIDESRSQTLSCNLPWNNFAIDCYGNVTVCCTMDGSALYDNATSIGNVIELGCEGVWKGIRAKKLRKENLDIKFDDFKICYNCSEKFKISLDDDNNSTIRAEMN